MVMQQPFSPVAYHHFQLLHVGSCLLGLEPRLDSDKTRCATAAHSSLGASLVRHTSCGGWIVISSTWLWYFTPIGS